MGRIIQEVDPPKLSSRIGKLPEGDQTTIAAARDAQPGKLTRFVRGDLDWVVMKALSKERERRYETATAFAQDIQHFLHHEPVMAGPPSAIYRMRRFAGKAPATAGGNSDVHCRLNGLDVLGSQRTRQCPQRGRIC